MKTMVNISNRSLSSRNILILGCNGQDGSLLCHSLLKKGIKVIGITKNVNGKSNNHVHLGIENDVEILECDITNSKKLSKIIESYQPETIYNLAGQSSVGRSFTEPKETIKSIVYGTQTILEIAKKLSFNGKIFFAGSGEMFGEINDKASINHIQQPKSPYGIAKQTSFNLVKLYRELYEIKCFTGIFFNHESHLRAKTFVTQKIIKAALDIYKSDKKDVKLKMGNLEVIRDWGWAPEYMEAIQIMTQSKTTNDHVICTGNAISLNQFIKIVFDKFDLNWKDFIVVDKNLFRPGEIMRSCGDPSQLKNELNWSAKININLIIDKMIKI